MKNKMKLFKIAYKPGLMSPVVVEAENEDAAIVAGLVEYRRRTGFVETVSEWPASKIVESATEVAR